MILNDDMDDEPLISNVRSPKSMQRRRLCYLFFIVFIFSVAFVAGFLLKMFLLEDKSSLHNAAVQSNEKFHNIVTHEMAASKIKENLKAFTSIQHVAGTPDGIKQSKYFIYGKWAESLGKENVALKKYNVLLSYPVAPGKVSIVNETSGAVLFTSKGNETRLWKDEFISNVAVPFNAYSAAKSVKGKLVYVNYGSARDFELLNSLNISCKGKILIARYGKNFRGNKVALAESVGAIGMILYTDPANYASGKTTYPNSWWMPPDGVQRGTIKVASGDPLTPGYPADEHTFRIYENQTNLPTIPVQPISYQDALPLIRLLDGTEIPKSWKNWKGGLDATYRITMSENSTRYVSLNVSTKRERRDIYNIVGTVKGSIEPDEEDKKIDYEQDHTETHQLFRKAIQILYEYGWCRDVVSWYNAKMGKIRLLSDDGSEDYLAPEEIDSVEFPFPIRVFIGLDRIVVIGNHHDAWVMGAVDPSSGSATLMEIIRAVGVAVKSGWKPRRTLMFCNWDAEEYGLIGSTEWLEDYKSLLENNVVAYLNMDTAVNGNYSIDVRGSQQLANAVFDAAKQLKDPDDDSQSLYEDWRKSFPDRKQPDYPRIRQPGAGSDHKNFYVVYGVPVVYLRYTYNWDDYNHAMSYPVYHSIHDSFHWMTSFVDPDFTHHLTLGRVLAKVAMTFVDQQLLSFNFSRLAWSLSQCQKSLIEKHGQDFAKHHLKLEYLMDNIKKFQTTAASFTEFVESLDTKSELQIRMANDKMMQVERSFLSGSGLPNRPFVKNVVFAPSQHDQYSGSCFPGLTDAIYYVIQKKVSDWSSVEEQLSILSFHILQATRVLTR